MSRASALAPSMRVLTVFALPLDCAEAAAEARFEATEARRGVEAITKGRSSSRYC